MKDKKKENAIKNLVYLYTVIIGVALSLSVRALVEDGTGLREVKLSEGLLFTSFLATLLPFYHGALRHIDDTYIENENAVAKDGAVVMDVLLLLLHAMAFVVLALLLRQPGQFAWILTASLTIDVVWGLFVHFASASKGGISPQMRWTIINSVFVGLAAAYLVTHDIYFQPIADALKVSTLILVGCVLRTVADYYWCREFYFPDSEVSIGEGRK